MGRFSSPSLFLILIAVYISVCVCDKEILKLTADCPSTTSGQLRFRLRSDVPGYAQAKCKNGDITFRLLDNKVDHVLVGSFDRAYSGPGCQVFKKAGSNTYTVTVEYGWGDEHAQGIFSTNIQTVSCAYDKFGNAISRKEEVLDAILAPDEIQDLGGPESPKLNFDLQLMDVMDDAIHFGKVDIGRKIRLYAAEMNNATTGFKAVSCVALNDISRYPILVAGCGDGLVIPRSRGFFTIGTKVYSPYFRAFRLRGAEGVAFRCNFTVCQGACDGDSCVSEKVKKRSLPDKSFAGARKTNATIVSAMSDTVLIEGMPEMEGEEIVVVTQSVRRPDGKARVPGNEVDSGKVQSPGSAISLPTLAGIILVLMCLIATILTFYFVLTTPRSNYFTVCNSVA